MIKRISIAMMAVALSAAAREEYTRTFDKTVALRGGARVYIEHRLGDIVVRTHAQPDVVIHADIKVSASRMDQAKSFADRIDIILEPSSSEIQLRTRYPERENVFPGFRNISYFVHYDVTIPETSPLEIRNSFGAVSVSGVKANSDITTSHGSLEFRDGRGTQRLEDSFANIKVANNIGDVSVEGSNGSIEAADVTGALNARDRFASVSIRGVSKGVTVTNSNGTVEVMDSGGLGSIRNSFGNVTVHNYKGDLTVNDTNGKIEAMSVDGQAELNTTFGEVRFSDIKRQISIRANNSHIEGERVGGPLTIQNSFGPVTVGEVCGGARMESGNGPVTISRIRGEANVKTSFGAVFLEGVTGAIQVENQNGAVEAVSTAQTNCQPIVIHTSFSTLRVRLQGQASYRISAHTSFGKITTDFPVNITGTASNDNLNGVIGGGRCEMRLTDENGTIEVLK